MSDTLSWAGTFTILIALHFFKTFLFRKMKSRAALATIFFSAIILCVPIAWLISSDWNKEYLSPLCNWIGEPVVLLTVPTASFAFDLIRNQWNTNYWRVRALIELIMLFPAWLFVWANIELHVLGWIFV